MILSHCGRGPCTLLIYPATGRWNKVCLLAGYRPSGSGSFCSRAYALHGIIRKRPCEPRCSSLRVILLPVQCSPIERYHSGHHCVSSSDANCYHIFTLQHTSLVLYEDFVNPGSATDYVPLNALFCRFFWVTSREHGFSICLSCLASNLIIREQVSRAR